MKMSRFGPLALVVPVWFLLAACGRGDAQVKAAGVEGSAAQATGRQASGTAGLGGLQFKAWAEPSEHAMTVDVPVGWRTDGALQWRGDLDARLQVVVTSPDGKVRVFLGDLEAMSRQVPSQWTFMQTGAREGQAFDVPATHSRALVQHFMTGTEYAKYHATERLCRDAKFIAVTDDPQGAMAMTRAIAPEAAKYNGTARISAGTATFTCGANQGEVYAATMLGSSNTGPIQGWIVFKVGGYLSADPLRSMAARYVMEHMLATAKLDPKWNAALEAKSMRITGVVMSMQNAATQAALQASRQQNETLARLNHPNTFVATSGVPKDSGAVNTILGTQHMCDAIGRCATVSIGDGETYMDHSGNVRNGPGSGGPPDNTGVWSPMFTQ